MLHTPGCGGELRVGTSENEQRQKQIPYGNDKQEEQMQRQEKQMQWQENKCIGETA